MHCMCMVGLPNEGRQEGGSLIMLSEKCDRKIGTVCVYLQSQCPYAADNDQECPNYWKLKEASQ